MVIYLQHSNNKGQNPTYIAVLQIIYQEGSQNSQLEKDSKGLFETQPLTKWNTTVTTGSPVHFGPYYKEEESSRGKEKKKETRLAENPKASDRRYRTEMKIHTIVTCLLLPE